MNFVYDDFYCQADILKMLSSISSFSKKVAPEHKHTAGNHVHAFMFFDCFLNEKRTVSILLHS